MTEETNWKKFLTEEVLKEIWHESKIAENSSCSCGRPYHLGTPYDLSTALLKALCEQEGV